MEGKKHCRGSQRSFWMLGKQRWQAFGGGERTHHLQVQCKDQALSTTVRWASLLKFEELRHKHFAYNFRQDAFNLVKWLRVRKRKDQWKHGASEQGAAFTGNCSVS